jgi:hypothetical protein
MTLGTLCFAIERQIVGVLRIAIAREDEELHEQAAIEGLRLAVLRGAALGRVDLRSGGPRAPVRDRLRRAGAPGRDRVLVVAVSLIAERTGSRRLRSLGGASPSVLDKI